MYGKTWIKKDCTRKEKVKLIYSKNQAQMKESGKRGHIRNRGGQMWTDNDEREITGVLF